MAIHLEDHGHDEDLDLEGADLRAVCLCGAEFGRRRPRRAMRAKARTRSCRFESCDVQEARLGASEHGDGAFLNCRFGGADRFERRFARCKMVGSGFEGAQWTGTRIGGGDWSLTALTALRGALGPPVSDLTRAVPTDPDLRGADRTRAGLAGAEFGGGRVRRRGPARRAPRPHPGRRRPARPGRLGGRVTGARPAWR